MANQPVGRAFFHGLPVGEEVRKGVAVGQQRINQQNRKAAEHQLDDLIGSVEPRLEDVP